MLQSDSKLVGDEKVKYSTESSDGERSVYITPTKIITEDNDSNNGRAVMLSDVEFIKKTTEEEDNTPIGWYLAEFILLIAVAVGVVSIVLTVSSFPEKPTGFFISFGFSVGTAISWVYVRKKISENQNKQSQMLTEKVWFNPRTNSGSVGFKIEKSKVSEIMEAMEEGLTNDVKEEFDAED